LVRNVRVSRKFPFERPTGKPGGKRKLSQLPKVFT